MQRWVRGALTGTAVLGLAAGLLAAGTAFGTPTGGGTRAPDAVATVAADPLTALRQRLERRPDDAEGWAALGLGYVEQARTSADPSAYGRAEAAFARSLEARPEDNDAALTGQATLAAARHDFAEALRLTDAALAVNGSSPTTYGVRTDALVELGRYDEALESVQTMLDLRPGVASLTRASYAAELRGEVERARELLEQALSPTGAGPEQAFVQHYLGELAWHTGDLAAARTHYDAALAADPASAVSLAARGRVLFAEGQTAAGLADLRESVRRVPLPELVVSLARHLRAAGEDEAAEQQEDVVRAAQQLFAAAGADVDLELALFEADSGDPVRALEYADAAYATRPDAVLVQDARAWALHRAGRSAEALPLARQAVRLGTRLPSLHFHLGAIAAAAGDDATAREALTTALSLNPHFDPLQADEARALLGSLS